MEPMFGCFSTCNYFHGTWKQPGPTPTRKQRKKRPKKRRQSQAEWTPADSTPHGSLQPAQKEFREAMRRFCGGDDRKYERYVRCFAREEVRMDHVNLVASWSDPFLRRVGIDDETDRRKMVDTQVCTGLLFGGKAL